MTGTGTSNTSSGTDDGTGNTNLGEPRTYGKHFLRTSLMVLKKYH